MKKLSLILLAAGLVAMQSCKEIGPNIDFGEGVQAGEDTAYTADIESPQAKNVLAEEFTGVSCPPCPNGHLKMDAIRDELGGKLVVVGYHIFNYPQANPVEKDGQLLSKYDFRTDDATEVGNTIFGGIGGMPLAGFDRQEVSGSKTLNTPNWSAAAASAATKSTPVNIHITSSFNDSSREATVIVTLAYTADVDMKQNLTLLVVEDSIVDAQKTLTSIEKEYVHEHVLRDIITPTYGAPIPDKVDPKVPGRVYQRVFKFPVSADWHEEHCHVVAFVNNDDVNDRTVMHAEEAKLME